MAACRDASRSPTRFATRGRPIRSRKWSYLLDATIDVAVDVAQAQVEYEAALAILSYDRLNTRSPWAPNYYPDANPDTGWQWILSSQN